MFHPFKEFIISLYVVISSCILISRRDLVRSILIISLLLPLGLQNNLCSSGSLQLFFRNWWPFAE